MSVFDSSYNARTREMEQARKQRAREVAIEAVSHMCSSDTDIDSVLARADIIARYIATGNTRR